MPDDPLFIRTFEDAVAAVLGIRDRFGAGHGVAVLDLTGRVIDLTVFTGEDHTIDTALDWASCVTLNDPLASRMVLLSAVGWGLRPVREADLELLRLARRVFGEDGVEVVDWVQTDGEDIRSLAFTLEPGAWGTAA
jgi:hypothetical protein